MKNTEALQAFKSKDFKKAYRLWEEESKKQNDQAMTNIGLMYLKGDGVKKDIHQAREWFLKASQYNNDSANYNLALMYQNELGVTYDEEKTFSYFKKAVEKKHRGAIFRLGHLLLKDRENENAVKEGFEYVLDAAKNKHLMAISMMGGLDVTANKDCKMNESFRLKTKEEQLDIVHNVIKTQIQPLLAGDGGDISLVEYINSPDIEIRMAYKGACAGCSFAPTSTFEFIRENFVKVIDENILVYVL